MLRKRLKTRGRCYVLPLIIMALAFFAGTHYVGLIDGLKEKNDQLIRQIAHLEEKFLSDKEKFLTELQKDEFEITAYEPSARSCGKWAKFGITKSGTSPNRLRTVAVDPDVIPIGSLVYIDGIGWRVAEDTGSRVKGKIIDVFFESVKEAREFGRQKKTVYYNKA
ncbi:MAG: 3D domain-containing protein [Nitrospirae bacterium]|nr:3D domain-containing protein [Nitrospirota bacterium]